MIGVISAVGKRKIEDNIKFGVSNRIPASGSGRTPVAFVLIEGQPVPIDRGSGDLGATRPLGGAAGLSTAPAKVGASSHRSLA
jgi:hypothetical protein